MMNHIILPKSFWGYAVSATSYLLNRVLLKAIESAPFEIYYKEKPNLKHIRVWGCPTLLKE